MLFPTADRVPASPQPVVQAQPPHWLLPCRARHSAACSSPCSC